MSAPRASLEGPGSTRLDSSRYCRRSIRSGAVGAAAGALTVSALTIVDRLRQLFPAGAGESAVSVVRAVGSSNTVLVCIVAVTSTVIVFGLAIIAAVRLPAVWSRRPFRRGAALRLVRLLIKDFGRSIRSHCRRREIAEGSTPRSGDRQKTPGCPLGQAAASRRRSRRALDSI
jgi:hypothetical protein